MVVSRSLNKCCLAHVNVAKTPKNGSKTAKNPKSVQKAVKVGFLTFLRARPVNVDPKSLTLGYCCWTGLLLLSVSVVRH